MPVELWTRLIVDIPLLGVLLLVLWKGGDKLEKLGDKFDKFGENFNKLATAVKGLSSRVDMIGKLTDARLELHEERTTKNGTIVTATMVRAPITHAPNNGALVPQRITQPSWPDTPTDADDE